MLEHDTIRLHQQADYLHESAIHMIRQSDAVNRAYVHVRNYTVWYGSYDADVRNLVDGVYEDLVKDTDHYTPPPSLFPSPSVWTRSLTPPSYAPSPRSDHYRPERFPIVERENTPPKESFEQDRFIGQPESPPSLLFRSSPTPSSSTLSTRSSTSSRRSQTARKPHFSPYDRPLDSQLGRRSRRHSTPHPDTGLKTTDDGVFAIIDGAVVTVEGAVRVDEEEALDELYNVSIRGLD